MIPKGTTLYPQYFTSDRMYFDDQPFAYWVSCSHINFCNWVLFKEYNDYDSVCNPNDCLAAVSYEQVMHELRTYSYYDGMDREKLCRAFRQRSLDMSYEEEIDFEDFDFDILEPLRPTAPPAKRNEKEKEI